MSMPHQTRVAYVNHTGAVSGAERVLINMVRGLDRARYDPIVICPFEGDLASLLKSEGVLCVALPAVYARFTWRPDRLWKALVSLVRAVFALRATLSRLAPDIVHANGLRAGIIASVASIATKRKVMWHVHDNLPRHPLSSLIRVSAFLLRPARVVAVSNSTARAFCGPFSFKGTISTIHNGIDLSRFPAKNAESLRLRGTLGVPENAFLICAVGQICARKGLLELVSAFEMAHAHAPQMHLVIAGSVVFDHERSYFELLRGAAASPQISAYVHFAGHVQDVSALLQAADLLVLNSHEEPFGLVLIEAMSSGTPVLATRVGGIPEIVKDSENGWLFDKSDTTALAEKMVELSRSKDLLEKTAQHARNVTCQQFAMEEFNGKLHRFYAELIPGNKRAIGRAASTNPCS